MEILPRLHQLPPRLAAGAYILNSGLTIAKAGRETAEGLHGTAARAYPFLRDWDPEEFAGVLSKVQLAVGAALLIPVVPSIVAGAALAGFAGGLLGMYLRTPALREPGSIRPSQQGTAVAKDVWMMGIALSLIVEELEDRSARRH
jgi:hypothetical protein